MTESDGELIREAIARNVGAVLSMPSAGMLRNHKSRFLKEDGEGIWVEGSVEDSALVGAVIRDGVSVGMAFKNSTLKVVFTSRVLREEREFAISAGVRTYALLLARPESIKTVQRRSNYRVHVPSTEEALVRVWRIAEHFFLADKPMASTEIAIELRDLSVGGMGITCMAGRGDKVRLTKEERLRVKIHYKDEDYVMEGRVRFIQESANGNIHAGVEFKKLEKDLEGRRALSVLTSIVGGFQRDEIRRNRLGLGA